MGIKMVPESDGYLKGGKKVVFLFELLIKRSVFPMGRLKSSLI